MLEDLRQEHIVHGKDCMRHSQRHKNAQVNKALIIKAQLERKNEMAATTTSGFMNSMTDEQYDPMR
jgi:hypothetical protein